MFWDTSINRRATTDGRHTRHPLPFYNPFFKLFVYKSVCSVCVCFVMSACLCVLVSISVCSFCMTVHDHVNIVYACTCVSLFVSMYVFVCWLPHTLPAACPGPQEAICFSIGLRQTQNRKGSILGSLFLFSLSSLISFPP